ncbi:hypothetical protein AAMO2058_001522100 [Amorphochlora amoebiformis]
MGLLLVLRAAIFPIRADARTRTSLSLSAQKLARGSTGFSQFSRPLGGVCYRHALRRSPPHMSGGGAPACNDEDKTRQFDPFRYEGEKPDLSQPFAKIQPIDSDEKMFTRVRCRQHVNPLAAMHQVLPEEPQLHGKEAVFEDPTLPLYVDLGCGSGRFLLQMAIKHKGCANFLGVEIRAPLAERANYWKNEFNVRNAHFVAGNINVNGAWDKIFANYPGPIVAISALMPDPWFKKRHKKRRMLTETLATTIAEKLAPGGEVAVAMRLLIAGEGSLEDITSTCSSSQKIGEDEIPAADEDPSITELKSKWLWLGENPTGIPTERETYVLEQPDGKVWRALFRKPSK